MSAPAMAPHTLNRFDYFEEIEAFFVRRRGKHMWLSPKDWALIQSWKDGGIPLHVVLRGIERAFNSHENSARRRDVNSLAYCRGAVEAQFAKWIDSQAGAHARTQDLPSPHEESTKDNGLPFPRSTILDHLSRSHAALTRAAGHFPRESATAFSEAVDATLLRLLELKEDFEKAEHPVVESLERELDEMEARLSDSILSYISSDQLSQERDEIEAQIRTYRSRAQRNVYEGMVNDLLRKRLRESYGIPPLSLFHL